MKRIDNRDIALVGLLSAFTVMCICILRVPGPGGNVYFHLGETVMLSSAVLLGGRKGAFIGAVAGSLADLLLGAALWAPFSFFIHGAKGFIVGSLSNGGTNRRDVAAMLAGEVIMVLGYTLLAGLLYGSAVMPVEFIGDMAQGGLGISLAFVLLKAAGASRIISVRDR